MWRHGSKTGPVHQIVNLSFRWSDRVPNSTPLGMIDKQPREGRQTEWQKEEKKGHTTPISTKDCGISSSLSALCGRGTDAAAQWRSVEVRHHRNRDASKITASINCLNALLWTRLQVQIQTPKTLSSRVKIHPVVLSEHFEMFWHHCLALDPEALITERGVCGA